MFVAVEETTDTRTEADKACKQKCYVCPKCRKSVVFAQGPKIRWHFRHKPNSECPYHNGETWQHEQAKFAILSGARSRGLAAEPELEVLSLDGDRRADVVIWAPQTDPPRPDDHRRYAFEVQYSALETAALDTRTNAYMAAGVPVIWIPVVDSVKLFGTDNKPKLVEKISGTNLFRAYAYSAPFWIEHIEKFLGHIWLYIPQTKSFWKGWLLSHFLYKNPSEGHDADGNEFSSGGYWYEAKLLHDLYLEGPYYFDDVRVSRVNHPDNSNIPANGRRKFLVDLRPHGKDSISGRRAGKRRRTHDNGFADYADWVLTGDGWQLAVFEALDVLPSADAPLPT